MIAILTVLTALPLGLLVRDRMAAYLAYAILYFAFTSAVYAVGFGLVTLGHRLRNRRKPAPETRLG